MVFNIGLYKNPGYDPLKNLIAADDQRLASPTC